MTYEKRKYPIGIQTFSRIIREGYVYIDKTDLSGAKHMPPSSVTRNGQYLDDCQERTLLSGAPIRVC